MRTQMFNAVACAAVLALGGAASAGEQNLLRELQVIPTAQGAQVVVAGTRAPTFTVFRMSDPDRLVVDLSGADVSAIKGHHDGSGPVDGIVVSQFANERQNVGRVMVALKDVTQYDVRTEGTQVRVTVKGGGAKEGASAPTTSGASSTAKAAPAAPQATAARLDALGNNIVSVQKEEQAVDHPAQRLSKIALDKHRLRLWADGELAHFEVLELSDPPRLALDVYGVSNGARAPKASAGPVKEVRVGAHAEKVRLVVDLQGDMPAWKAARTPHGMELRFDRPVAVAAAGPSKLAPRPAEAEAEIDGKKIALNSETSPLVALPTPPPAANKKPLAEITDVLFDESPEGGRLRVKFSGTPTWTVERPDPRSAVLTLSGTVLPKRLERSLDTSALDLGVKMVSAFSVPGEGNRVRLVAASAVAFNSAVGRVEKTKDGLLWPLTVADKKNEQAVSQVKTAPVSTTSPEVLVEKEVQGQAGRRYTGKLVTFEFKDIDIHNLLRVIAEVSKKNVVVADDVSGRVTIRLRNVPWDEALDLILRSKALGKEEFGSNIIRIAPLKTLEEEARLRAEQEKARRIVEPLVVQLIPVNYAAADAMSARVKDILSERGSVSVDARTNVLVVRDVASFIAKARSLVETLDTQTPQVLIESRIVEASTNFSRQIGVQWGGNAQAAPATNNATGLAFPNTISATGGAGQTPSQGTADTPNFAVNLPAATGTNIGGALGFVFGSAGGALNLNLRLSALENQGTVKTISAPKVTTLNNITARISQGVSIPFSQASAQGVNTTFVEARLQLEVTPHITLDGSVLMNIHAENNQPDPSNTGANGQPAIQRKEAATQVLVKDGDTTVIGGIYVRSGGTQISGIPFLSNIPILGFFFKRTTDTDSRQELLIFITPRIINRQTMAQSL